MRREPKEITAKGGGILLKLISGQSLFWKPIEIMTQREGKEKKRIQGWKIPPHIALKFLPFVALKFSEHLIEWRQSVWRYILSSVNTNPHKQLDSSWKVCVVHSELPFIYHEPAKIPYKLSWFVPIPAHPHIHQSFLQALSYTWYTQFALVALVVYQLHQVF